MAFFKLSFVQSKFKTNQQNINKNLLQMQEGSTDKRSEKYILKFEHNFLMSDQITITDREIQITIPIYKTLQTHLHTYTIWYTKLN